MREMERGNKSVREPLIARYSRQPSQKGGLSLGVSLTQAKERLSKPVKRSSKEIRWAMGIVGIGEGPKDLSENMRAYLQRDK